jgi:hypothetical protein
MGKSSFEVVGRGFRAKGLRARADKQMSWWVWPVAIGASVLLALMIFGALNQERPAPGPEEVGFIDRATSAINDPMLIVQNVHPPR